MAEPEAVRLQMEEIKTMADRSDACALLLRLQRASAHEASAMESLALFSPPLLPSLLRDTHSPDEEIAALALKCLGFNLYHPSLVAGLSEEVAQSVLDSLVNLVLATRMKAICNLGVWCLAVQQLKASILEPRAKPLVHAIAYALDNPFGSLSVTLEATQAAIKLADQIPNCIKDMSDMWAPQIYRRLLSTDKTECDMAERCLLKLSSVISPPHISLSKVVASDLNQNLVISLRDMIHDHQKKIQAIKVWGWFIYLLGLDAPKNTCLINKMLKVPESTFTDSDPQVQVATLVSWRHLIDALQPLITNFINTQTSDIMLQSLLKKIKLVLIPLKGIVSNKCNLAVQSCCLRTWLHLIRKLVPLLNRPLILELAFGSFIEIIFSIGPDMPLWVSCVDLFHGFVLSKIEQKVSHIDGCIIVWVPWDVSILNFHLKMIGLLFSVQNLKSKEAGLKIFRTLMQGIRIELVTSCCFVKTIFKFFIEVYEGKLCDFSSLHLEFLRCLKANPNNSIEISFLEDLCEFLLEDVDGINGYFIKNLSFLGDIITVIIENAMILEKSRGLLSIRNSLELVSRFLKLSIASANPDQQSVLGTINRVIASLAKFIGDFSSMQDFNLLFEAIAEPLTQLLSLRSSVDNEVHNDFIQQLQTFWSLILDCLDRSQPPIFTKSFFLKTHFSLFKNALEHPHSPISEATAEFLKTESRLDKIPEDDAFEMFEGFSKRFGVSVLNENAFKNDTAGPKRKRLKTLKYVEMANMHDACKNYGHIFGSCSKIQVASDNGTDRREVRRPEVILEMVKRKR